MYYKRQSDNTIINGRTIHGPDFVLDDTTKDQTYDGWKWFDTPEGAYAYFAGNFEGHVTPRQFRLALIANGINISVIDDMLADNPSGLVEWNFASSIDRQHPLVISLGDAMGKKSEEIDAIFELAKTL